MLKHMSLWRPSHSNHNSAMPFSQCMHLIAGLFPRRPGDARCLLSFIWIHCLSQKSCSDHTYRINTSNAKKEHAKKGGIQWDQGVSLHLCRFWFCSCGLGTSFIYFSQCWLHASMRNMGPVIKAPSSTPTWLWPWVWLYNLASCLCLFTCLY